MFSWLPNLKVWAIEALAAIAAVLAVWFLGQRKGEQAGEAKVTAKAATETIAAVQKTSAISQAVQNLPDGQAQTELKDQWSRD